MRDGQLLAVSEKVHVVFADNRSASDGVDTYLGRSASRSLAVSAVNGVECADAVYRLVYCDSGAGRGVELFVVVRFDNFNVERVAQKLGGFFGEIAKKIYAKAHIACLEHGDFFGSVGNLF